LCRHLAWLGEPRTLSQLVLEPEHGLLRQSWQPRRQKRGLMNADGWGVGYFSEGRAEPARWRSASPLWHDASFASVAPTVSSGAVLAAVRSASPGMPLGVTATAPFTDGTWLFSLNGLVDRGVLPASRGAESMCDAALLAVHTFDRGVDLVAATVLEVGTADPEADLNVLLTDGRRIVSTTWGNSLSYLVEPDGVVVASEPWDDDPRWVDVPDRHLLVATPDHLTLTPLES
jgi:gamma-glutamyl hercynylcysteine S-oxide hydrolase